MANLIRLRGFLSNFMSKKAFSAPVPGFGGLFGLLWYLLHLSK